MVSVRVHGFREEPAAGAVMSSIIYTGMEGGDRIAMQEAISHIKPTRGAAHGRSVITVHGVAFLTDIFVCGFELTGTIVMATIGERKSASEIFCPTPFWGQSNAAGVYEFWVSRLC